MFSIAYRKLRRHGFIALCFSCTYIVLHTLFVFPSLNFDLTSVTIAASNRRPSLPSRTIYDKSIKPADVCITVITGFSDVPRKGLAVRLLKQIVEQLEELRINEEGIAVALNLTLTLSVFCQGPCKVELMNAIVPSAAVKAVMKFHEILLPLRAFNKMGDEGKLKRDYDGRHIVISWNYRKVFEQLFIPSTKQQHQHQTNSSTSSNSIHDNEKNSGPCPFAIIFEDDLILSPDALRYLLAGKRLLQTDSSVFSVSLFGDNSYPPLVHSPSVFRRVSHFAGLGFITSRENYVRLLRPVWKLYAFWDVTVQRVMLREGLSSVTPEISRTLHIENDQIQHPSRDIVVSKDIFDSMVLNDRILLDYDSAFAHLQRDLYDHSIRSYIINGTLIDELYDVCALPTNDKAGVFDIEDWRKMYVYVKCRDSDDLHAILSALYLIGRGLDGVVRGEYEGTLFLRFCRHRVLILCRHSSFVTALNVRFHGNRVPGSSYTTLQGNRQSQSTIQLSAVQHGIMQFINDNNNNNDEKLTFDSSLQSPVLRKREILTKYFERYYRIKQMSADNSCSDVCKAQKLTCDLSGMWLLATSGCDVFERVYPACKQCRVLGEVKHPRLAKYPLLINSQALCVLGNPHYSSCLSRTFDYYPNGTLSETLLCACKL